MTVTGGKGGVGKSSISLNLSIALSEHGARVLLFDADLGLANLDVMLGINPPFTLEDVIDGKCRLAQTVYETGYGVDLLPGGAGIPSLADLGSLALVRLIGQLRELESSYDYIIIDTAAGIGESVARFALPADDVLLVCTPEPPAMLDAYSVLKMLCAREYGGNLHLVVNMARGVDEVVQTHTALDRVVRHYLGRPLNLLGGLQYDEEIVRCIKAQKPVMSACPGGASAQTFRSMIPGLYGLPAVLTTTQKQGFFGRLVESVRRVVSQ
jgi:flagellar biosynthesis protein FlhG